LIAETFPSLQDFGLFVSLGELKPGLPTVVVTQQTLPYNSAVADYTALTGKIINVIREAR
jgi:hypothetical protein